MAIRTVKLWCAAAVLGVAGIAYAQTLPIQPGMWEITTRMTSMTGMPPQMAGMMSRPHTLRNCVTPEEAREGMQTVLRRSSDKKCNFTRFNAARGRYSYEMSCTGKSATTVTASGTYTPSSYTGASRIVTDGGKMVITGTASGRLVGTCKGKG